MQHVGHSILLFVSGNWIWRVMPMGMCAGWQGNKIQRKVVRPILINMVNYITRWDRAVYHLPDHSGLFSSRSRREIRGLWEHVFPCPLVPYGWRSTAGLPLDADPQHDTGHRPSLLAVGRGGSGTLSPYILRT